MEANNEQVNDKRSKKRDFIRAAMIGCVCGVVFILAAKMVSIALK